MKKPIHISNVSETVITKLNRLADLPEFMSKKHLIITLINEEYTKRLRTKEIREE